MKHQNALSVTPDNFTLREGGGASSLSGSNNTVRSVSSFLSLSFEDLGVGGEFEFADFVFILREDMCVVECEVQVLRNANVPTKARERQSLQLHHNAPTMPKLEKNKHT